MRVPKQAGHFPNPRLTYFQCDSWNLPRYHSLKRERRISSVLLTYPSCKIKRIRSQEPLPLAQVHLSHFRRLVQEHVKNLTWNLFCSAQCNKYPFYLLFRLAHSFCFTESEVKMSSATVRVLFPVSPVLECLGTLFSFILGKEMLYPWLMGRVKRVSESVYQSLKIMQQSWMQQHWFGFQTFTLLFSCNKTLAVKGEISS